MKDIFTIQRIWRFCHYLLRSQAMERACKFSFEDLFQASFGRTMTALEKSELYQLSQEKRNQKVGDWAHQAGWQTDQRQGNNGVTYTAFWDGGEKYV